MQLTALVHLSMHLCAKLTNLSDMKYFGYHTVSIDEQTNKALLSSWRWWQYIELAAN